MASSAPAGVTPVLGPLCRPKRPGKKPFLGLILSIVAVCSFLQFELHGFAGKQRRRIRVTAEGASEHEAEMQEAHNRTATTSDKTGLFNKASRPGDQRRRKEYFSSRNRR